MNTLRSFRDTVWGVLTGLVMDNNTPSLVMHEVREIETWILRLLSAPVPVPGKTRVEVRTCLLLWYIADRPEGTFRSNQEPLFAQGHQ